jgi:hypothetical protein
MSLMATARGRIQKRIVEVVTVTAELASRLRCPGLQSALTGRQAVS